MKISINKRGLVLVFNEEDIKLLSLSKMNRIAVVRYDQAKKSVSVHTNDETGNVLYDYAQTNLRTEIHNSRLPKWLMKQIFGLTEVNYRVTEKGFTITLPEKEERRPLKRYNGRKKSSEGKSPSGKIPSLEEVIAAVRTINAYTSANGDDIVISCEDNRIKVLVNI